MVLVANPAAIDDSHNINSKDKSLCGKCPAGFCA